jgi:hypothetical protein
MAQLPDNIVIKRDRQSGGQAYGRTDRCTDIQTGGLMDL